MVAKLRCGSLCLFVHLVCLCISVAVFSPLCVPAATLVYVSCHVYGCVFTSAYMCSLTNTFKMVCIWGPCWAGCAILFLGLLSPPPEPQIVSHPYDIWNVTGQDVIFGCEVFAYPMASIEWRKDGLDIQLPGDDPHISVQVGTGSRGLPGAAHGPPRTMLLTPPGSSLGVDPRGLR